MAFHAQRQDRPARYAPAAACLLGPPGPTRIPNRASDRAQRARRCAAGPAMTSTRVDRAFARRTRGWRRGRSWHRGRVEREHLREARHEAAPQPWVVVAPRHTRGVERLRNRLELHRAEALGVAGDLGADRLAVDWPTRRTRSSMRPARVVSELPKCPERGVGGERLLDVSQATSAAGGRLEEEVVHRAEVMCTSWGFSPALAPTRREVTAA